MEYVLRIVLNSNTFGCLIFSRIVLIIMFYFVPEYTFEWLGVADFSLRAVDTKYECVHKEGSLNKFCRYYSIYQRTRQGKKEKAIHRHG